MSVEGKKKKRGSGIEPDVGVEPTTLRLRVSRSTAVILLVQVTTMRLGSNYIELAGLICDKLSEFSYIKLFTVAVGNQT